MHIKSVLFSRTPLRGRPLFAYGFAVALPLVLTALKFGTGDLTSYLPPLLLFTFSVIASALLGGGGPGLVTTVLGGVLAWFFFVPAGGAAVTSPVVGTASLVVYSIMGVTISWVVAELRRESRRRREQMQQADLERERAELLLREMRHRVKNSLQMIGSILSLQSTTSADPAQRQIAGDASRRVAAVIRLHARLYEGNLIDTVEFLDYVRGISSDIAAGSGSNREARVSGTSFALPVDRAVQLALILSELLTNSFKYAYPDGEPGAAEIECRREEGWIHCRVADRGIGLPAGFDPAQAKGLGFRLITSILQSMGGKLVIEPSGKGARFLVSVPA
ncbi:MAG TPA: histidine kinase dimerization/phosphoacceptor domain -containing protein [Candidatus Angelobacter sp.]|nr:histidine kinase dimerization/phosphoacceptor domain -containing protein [Candidatus Angelobacter sp.]